MAPDRTTAKFRIPRNAFVRYGVPLSCFTVAGFYGLVHFLEGNSEIRRASQPPQLLKEGEIVQSKVDLQEELRKLQEQMNINKYEFVKIPRKDV